ncbi:UD11 glucuronosyltransferase, partial [Cnemophilus loriae]|nr:UD11 glucuronosyltransferase [Cnemophilus loriae]
VPVDGSHWLSMREVADSLRQKGHEVVVLAPDVSLHIKPSKNFVMKKYSVPYMEEDLKKEFPAFFHFSFEQGSFLERFVKAYQSIKTITTFGVSSCGHLLQNKELIRYLEENEF